MSDDIVVVLAAPRVGDGVREDIADVVDTSVGVVCTLGVETCLTEGVADDIVVTRVVCFVEDMRTGVLVVCTPVVVV